MKQEGVIVKVGVTRFKFIPEVMWYDVGLLGYVAAYVAAVVEQVISKSND